MNDLHLPAELYKLFSVLLLCQVYITENMDVDSQSLFMSA